jgi:hypothetical protein
MPGTGYDKDARKIGFPLRERPSRWPIALASFLAGIVLAVWAGLATGGEVPVWISRLVTWH